MTSVANFLLFQTLWFGSVFGAAHGYAWAGPACLGLFIVCHFKWLTKDAYADMLLMAACLLLGLVVDTAGSLLGLVSFVLYDFNPITPVWLLCLWAGFALTINHSMSWMKTQLLLATIAGAVFGPLSYYAGWQAGAMQWLQPALAAGFISISWALLMPGLCWLARRIERSHLMLESNT